MAKYKFTKSITIVAAAFFIAACSESGQNTETAVQSDPEAELKQLMHEAEEARAHADKLGFEWSITKPLLDDAHAAYKAGDHQKAHALFEEAKHQSMLAVEQAHYAEEHWQLLIPGK